MIDEDIARGGYTEEDRGEFFQEEGMPMSTASPETIKKVKQILDKMGVSIKDLTQYAKDAGLDVRGVNGVADVVNKIIAVAEGKEDTAIVEEMVHIATSILEQKNPNLVTEMISKIDRFAIYNRTLKQYRDNPAYQLPNGKPNIRKIKKEAVDKLIAELIIAKIKSTINYLILKKLYKSASLRQRIILKRWRINKLLILFFWTQKKPLTGMR
jgi:hypothetical protein